MVKIVRLKTEHVQPMKVLVEVLKEILTDVAIEFIRQPDEDVDNSDEVAPKIQNKKKGKKNEVSETKPKKFSGMRILAMSTSKNVLICLKIFSQGDVEFMCKPKSFVIGVRLEHLNKMLKSTDKDDELEMYVDNDDKQSLVLLINNNDMHKSSEFKLKLMDIDTPRVKLPIVSPDVMITMDASEFQKLCKDMAQIGKYLEIKCTSNTLIFTCVGENASRETKYRTCDAGVKIILNNPNQQLIVQGIYELEHLNLFTKCSSLSNDVQLLMKVQKYPLCIKYTVATLGEFIACIIPVDLQEKDGYDENDALFDENDDIEFKNGDENKKEKVIENSDSDSDDDDDEIK